uniref:Uncharacterized protein n=1 Tax=Alexandrium monilatum TaxID=311494 RepID=A0A7S4SBJ2_9DINO
MPAAGVASDVLLAPDVVRPRHATAFLLHLRKGKYKTGRAYTGIKRGTQPPGAPHMSASGWASYAFRAALGAQAAERQARRAMASATRHEWIARASAEQSRSALLEAQQLSRSASVQMKALRPFMRFCKQVATFLDANPGRLAEPAVQRLRRFCGGMDAHLDRTLREGETVASDIGLHYYDAPPAEYPHRPMWPPAAPMFHASLQDSAPPSLGVGIDQPGRSFL